MVRYATFGRRLWGTILDLLIDLIVLGMLSAIIGDGNVAGSFGMWYLLHHVGLVVEGGTLGHRLVGLRIVDLDGSSVHPVRAFVREIARIGLSLPPLGLGMLWMLDQPERRTWHDLLASTIVVHESRISASDSPVWAAAPPWRVNAHN